MTQIESNAHQSEIPVASEVHRQRCPNDRTTLYYYTEQGLSLQCRHCKGISVIVWSEILRHHTELCTEAVPHD